MQKQAQLNRLIITAAVFFAAGWMMALWAVSKIQ
jgi:hypothetical protein